MTCETCVTITSLNESLEQELIFLRSRNKILSTVNRALRERIKAVQENFDHLVTSLYEFDTANEQEELDKFMDSLAIEGLDYSTIATRNPS